jgi:hypothetical protein
MSLDEVRNSHLAIEMALLRVRHRHEKAGDAHKYTFDNVSAGRRSSQSVTALAVQRFTGRQADKKRAASYGDYYCRPVLQIARSRPILATPGRSPRSKP